MVSDFSRSHATRIVSRILLACIVVTVRSPIMRADLLILGNGEYREVIVQKVFDKDLVAHVNYWTLKVWPYNSSANLSSGEPELHALPNFGFPGAPAQSFQVQLKPEDLNRIKDNYKRVGLNLNIFLRSGKHVDLSNCDLIWTAPKGYVSTAFGKPVDAHYTSKNLHVLPLKTRERTFAEIQRIRFEDGSLTVTPKDGPSYSDVLNMKGTTPDGPKDFTGTIKGFIYAGDGSSEDKPYFLATSIGLDEAKEIVVTGIPMAMNIPSILSVEWSQLSGGDKLDRRNSGYRATGISPSLDFHETYRA